MRILWIEVGTATPKTLLNKLHKTSTKFCDGIVLNEPLIELPKFAGVPVISPQGDIQLINEPDKELIEDLKKQGKKVCLKIIFRNRSDEDKALTAVEKKIDYLIINCPDWKIIPLENLIAKAHEKITILAEVTRLDEIKVALETLEIGVDGIVFKPSNLAELESASNLVKGVKTRQEEKAKDVKIELNSAIILSLKPLSMGLRVCIDSCELMQQGEGMLVGCQSSALFLIQGEVEESPYVEPRPFRVNAGPLSLYILTPKGKTRYLSELKAGDEVLIVDRNGNQRIALIGRIKIERRPLLLVEAEVKGRVVKTIVQNAETIRFITKKDSKSVVDLGVGDEILTHCQLGGRHFGVLVEEELIIER